ncbi:MAG: PQQ-binding-like beta-propeller repeat protein [Planctomycetota bacterium]
MPDQDILSPDALSRETARAAYQGALWTAGIAGLFVLVVAVLMGVNWARTLDPRDSQELIALKQQLTENPRDEALKERIRRLDLALRREYFDRQAFASRGVWLLTAGILVFLIAGKVASDLAKKLPMPQDNPGPHDAEARRAALARTSLAGVTTALVAAFALLGWLSWRGLPPEAAAKTGVAQAPSTSTEVARQPAYPSRAEKKKHWPRFRGPGGLGVASYTNAPTTWNGESGENILWKTEIPLDAPNSPVVWGDRIFLSGSTKERFEVYCFSLDDGRLLWTGKAEGIPGSPAEPPRVMESTGYAAPTMCTDGRRAYAIFATGDLIAFDMEGNRVWAKNLGVPANSYGHASSLLTWRDHLIVLMDQGMEDDDKSKLYAFEGATGRQVWATVRPVGPTWGTPIAVEAGGREQIITVAVPWVMAYAPETGEELWRADIMDGEIAPSPVFADGKVLVAQSYSVGAAIRADGTGDVTQSHVAWRVDDGLPETASPVTDGELFYLLASDGLVTVYEVATGEKVWEHEFKKKVEVPDGDGTRVEDYPLHCLASPTIVGDRAYIWDEKGLGILFATGREVKELGRNPLGERVVASPACLDGRMIVRGGKHLFCIGTP